MLSRFPGIARIPPTHPPVLNAINALLVKTNDILRVAKSSKYNRMTDNQSDEYRNRKTHPANMKNLGEMRDARHSDDGKEK
jgi:hypothetical protein